MRFNTWGNDMGEPLCEVDEDNLCRIEIVRYSDRDFDIYQTARERRLGLEPDSTLLQPDQTGGCLAG